VDTLGKKRNQTPNHVRDVREDSTIRSDRMKSNRILASAIVLFVLFDHIISYLNCYHETNPVANYFIDLIGCGYFLIGFLLFIGLYFLLVKLLSSIIKIQTVLLMFVLALIPNFIHTILLIAGISFRWEWSWNLVYILSVFLIFGFYSVSSEKRKAM